MAKQIESARTPDPVRRAAVAAAVMSPFVAARFARGIAPDARDAATRRGARPIRIGVIGCGGRGTGAALNALEAGDDVRIVALADAFPDRLASSRQGLRDEADDRAAVDDAHCFVGLDAYKRLLDSADVDLVILATPPGFRPIHFAAAIDAGKNAFLEKPVAVDGPGIRQVIDAARRADEKRLSVVAGTQRRHQRSYLEAIERIRRGDIGDVVTGRCYWNQGGLWNVEPAANRSDVENQMRNWLYHTWLSGDHIVEQHVHQLDVCCWVFGARPTMARAVGGRQARTDPRFGHIFDHFGVEYVFPTTSKEIGEGFVFSMCRQQDGTDGRVEETFTGTRGLASLRPGAATLSGPKAWTFSGPDPNPYVEEHRALQQSVRTGRPINEGVQVAESTLTAIMGRMAAYTGRDVTWEQALNSREELMPRELAFGPRPVAPVAIPGTTKLS